MPSYALPKLSDPKAQAAREVEASRLGTLQAHHPKIAALRSIVPFTHYAISGIDYRGLGVGSGVMLASDMPAGFLRTFIDQDLFDADPMSSRITPLQIWSSWHDLTPDEGQRPELEPIRRLELAYGIAPRSCVAFYRGDFRYGAAVFARTTPFSGTEKFILEAASRMIHAELAAERLTGMTAHAGLSAGEISCLKTAAHGLSAEEASKITGYTPETIASYIKSATKKLGTANRTHAVAEAVRRRLFE